MYRVVSLKMVLLLREKLLCGGGSMVRIAPKLPGIYWIPRPERIRSYAYLLKEV